ncbi:2OG-Fe dioxygenase-domain-containing protein [Emericellopsis atlantica]|uniref:2OG-Fe dioxygenase-domain-containing protein n=1 Tax=Emericellopsis atlantica TaxID=2614577 RepID=A0A9P7ZDT9_9HYPO|nr:2OG-Fe dioxygenase-domain-containing protein [Emericellopsis atlantica]KAG9250294.1 2OG-Fe dioxygenase-domain-containing protein [Emericellopsis atlantica]
MSYLAPSKRAARASSNLLRSASRAAAGASNSFAGQQRVNKIHASSKDKAVHATTQPAGLGAGLPEFMTAGMTPVSTPTTATPTSTLPRVPAGQLNVLEQSRKPEFYQAISKIMAIRKDYVEKRFVWVPAEEMIDICLGLGATREDLEALPQTADGLQYDPTLPFRKTRNGRFCFDYDTQSVRRLEFQPFALSAEEDFKRYDSGQIRRFDEIDDELQLNTVLQALLVFKGMVVHGVEMAHRPKLDYDVNKNILTLFHLRTTTNQEILGEPALEGIHSDGVDHTMTTLLGHRNMRADSAVTFMHAMHEQTGIPLNDAKPENIRARVQHTKLLDTLMILDHENKHSLSPVYQEDLTQDATRDMLVFFTRKPVEEGHISSKIDSKTPHKVKKMEIPLFLPRTQ